MQFIVDTIESNVTPTIGVNLMYNWISWGESVINVTDGRAKETRAVAIKTANLWRWKLFLSFREIYEK